MSRRYIQNASSSGGLLGWVAILGGGYIVLNMLGINPLTMIENAFGLNTTSTIPVTTGTSPQANNPGTGGTGTGTTATTNPATMTIDPTSVQGKILALAGGTVHTLMSFDEWNYYYNQVRGIPGPDPGSILTEANRAENLSFADWWGYMTKAGFSGLGMVANFSPYTGGYGYGPTRGQGIIPLGSEMYTRFLS